MENRTKITQEEKGLLLKDLCARLPYGVKGIITYNGDKDIFTIKGIFNILFLSDTECCHIEDFKPYLRPMSSMTEREKQEFENITGGKIVEGGIVQNSLCIKFATVNVIEDWLNKYHFDYRGLIPKGLAIEAPEDIYKKRK